MSLGSAVDYTSVECTGSTYSYIFIGPLIYSTDTTKDTLHKYDIAMVTSSGNEDQRNGEALFGCLPGALSVAALDSDVNNPEVAYFSNIAPYTDFIDNGQLYSSPSYRRRVWSNKRNISLISQGRTLFFIGI